MVDYSLTEEVFSKFKSASLLVKLEMVTSGVIGSSLGEKLCRINVCIGYRSLSDLLYFFFALGNTSSNI